MKEEPRGGLICRKRKCERHRFVAKTPDIVKDNPRVAAFSQHD
ncbi:hypothetical protein [Paraburkholderia sp. ZP32-5]|nr:hypothetical protein [Paraburkholderia sp. ZP32-5]